MYSLQALLALKILDLVSFSYKIIRIFYSKCRTMYVLFLTHYFILYFFQFDQPSLFLPSAEYYELGFNHPIIQAKL